MRHLKKGRKIGREKSNRQALLKNLAKQVFQHGKIKTTEAKAKEVRSLVERVITLAKKKDLHARRQILALFQDKELVHKILSEVERFETRQGGYCRILKVGPRAGDAAPMVLIELV
ncbi:MAG TPA: 50S ribosomal protein L17 [Candidatus Subteraquimicrobiales bacterium]|uniref:Large ribosomal subunit protein bL17 n=1 Tax=uncultured actinobacterium Rifle_16ft_4_minimus_550 TaxID=1665149 RepID=A0A0H4T972_9ACTN|nr:50S ribosomal protein L17 RplQ [uncultured actinobacterium Rifle_16ft_4_minimus_550]